MPRELSSHPLPHRPARAWPNPRVAVAVGLLALALVVPPQLLGGIEGWAIGLTASLALVALAACHVATVPILEVPYRWPLLAVMLALVGWTALQAMPLPCGLVEWVAPTAAGHVLTNRELLQDASAGTCTLSWDPGSTRWEIAKGVAIVASFLSAWLLSAAGHRRKVLGAVAVSATLMAIVGLSHFAMGADAVFGVYEPRYTMARPVLAPLLNPNQLAGFLAMGVPVLAGLGLGTHHLALRLTWMLGALVCGATAVLTLSRGGVAGLVAGLVLLGALMLRRRRGGSRGASRLAWMAGLSALILSAAAYLALEPVSREVASGDLSKLELIGQAAEFSLEQPWMGVGRGAFAAAFVQAGDLTQYRAEHPESFFVQWASEWGLPAALALLVILAVALVRAAGTLRSVEQAGALAAVGSVAVHELVDFSLELVGMAVVAAAVLGAAVAHHDRKAIRREKRAAQPTPAPLARSALPVAIAGAALLALLLPSLARGSVRSLQDELTAALQTGNHERFEEHLRYGLALHPSEPAIAVLAATEAVHRDDPRALHWLNRAMALAPSWPAPHALAARWLWARGARDQAMLELRAAATISPGAAGPFICDELAPREDAAAHIDRAAPVGPLRPAFLAVAASCLPPRAPAAAEVDALLLEASPEAIHPRLRLARRLSEAGEVERALAEIEKLARAHPGERKVWLTLAHVQLQAGDPEAAAQALRRAGRLPGPREPLLRTRARTEAAMGRYDAMSETLQTLRGLSMGSPERMAAASSLEGQLWKQAGRPASALRAFERAHRADPQRKRLELIARTAKEMGDRVRALRTYLKLCHTYPDVPRYCKIEQRLRSSMTNGAASPVSE